MASIFLKDNRVSESTPKADLMMEVDQTDNIYQKIKELANLIQTNSNTAVPGWSNVLHIFCYNAEAGLQLGSGVDHKNVAKAFLPLRFKVGKIIIHGCGAASIYTAGNNGALMCQKLANSAYANVTASNSTPHFLASGPLYNNSNHNQQINWKGIVGTWNQFGKLIMLQEYSEAGVLIHDINNLGNNTARYFTRSSIPVLSAVKSSKSFEKTPVITIIRTLPSLFINQIAHYLDVSHF